MEVDPETGGIILSENEEKELLEMTDELLDFLLNETIYGKIVKKSIKEVEP